MTARNIGVGILCAGALLSTGCATIGWNFNQRAVPTLVVGKTTRAQVLKTFGEPFQTGTEDGDPTFTYVDYRLVLISTQHMPTADHLYIRFDKQTSIVKSYSYNTNNVR